jgi:hypothetical protein
MTTINHTFFSAHTVTRRPVSHGFWSGAGVGLAAILIVLTFAMAGIWAGPRTQADAAWQTSKAPPVSGGFENSVPPELFPLTGYDFATSY